MTTDVTMADVLAVHPGAQRALFRAYHIGGCASCGFRPDETLADVCARNGGLDPDEVLASVRRAAEEDEAMMVSPTEARAALDAGRAEAIDIRTREEFEAVHIAGTRRFDQALMQEILGQWQKDRAIIVVDHTGLRSLDAAAYLAGHGFQDVKCLRGGIDAWSVEVDPTLPRYTLD